VAVAAAGAALALVGALVHLPLLIGLGVVVAAAAAAVALAGRSTGRMRELDRLLPGEGTVDLRLEAFRGAVERDRALHGVERDLAGVRVQSADVRARLAGVAQLEVELGGLRERITAALGACDIDASDLGEGLRRYDRAEADARTRHEATLTRTRATDELRRLLGDDSLEAARTRLAQLEGRLNGHAELATAAAETYRDFAPLLNASLEAGIARLTGGRYAHAFVDEDLRIRVEAPETGAVVDLDRLSVGTQKQAYLVQRLELVRLLCPGAEALPVLLDDPFAHFDADRLERTLAWLAEAAAERQIIVFATQRRAADLAPSDAVLLAL
jgi:hypothetical protein